MWTPRDIARLYEAHGHMLTGRCRRLLGSGAEAHDAVQDVFLRVLEQPDGFRGRSAELTWLYAVATNVCLQRLRARAIRDERWQESVAHDWTQRRPEENPEQTFEMKDLVERIFAEADPLTATMATLHFVDGLDQGEVARVVERSRVTVNQKLQAFRAAAGRARSLGAGEGDAP